MKLKEYLKEEGLEKFWELYKKNRDKVQAKRDKNAKNTRKKLIDWVRTPTIPVGGTR